MSVTDPSPSPEELVALVAKNPLVSEIEPAYLRELADQLQWIKLESSEVLFREGDSVDALYFVIEGLVEVTTLQQDLDGNPDNDRIVLAELGPNSTVGEMQIISGGTRSATVSAKEPSGLIKFSRTAFNEFLAKDGRVVDELTKTIMPRLYRDQMVAVLPSLFGELDADMLRDLESKMSWMHLPRGHVLFYQGEPSDGFFIIMSGRLEVLIRDSAARSRAVTEMSQGESVGEMGVFTGEPRSSTVRASRDSELVAFSKQEFDEFIERYPPLMRRMTRQLIGRLQRAYRKATHGTLSKNVLLAPATEGAPLADFGQRLLAALTELASHSANVQPCLLLTSRAVEEHLGIPGIAETREGKPNDLRLRSWLSEQEKRYQVILFQADFASSEWTMRCIRQADEIIYVGESGGAPEASQVVRQVQTEEERNKTHRRCSLVLLHPPHVHRPTGTEGWLRALGLAKPGHQTHAHCRHFHVRQGRASDYARLARFVAGREIGLALSGGGARGFAHVGCIRAMRELGIPIDMIGGVSMGSLVAAAYAFDPEQFDETIGAVKSRLQGALFDFTAPVVSIARGRRFDRRLRSWFGETKVEDLWMPYFCVSSNLTEADIVVHDSGPLWWAVRASGTLPGLITPMVKGRSLLYDGCLLDNLPMDVMRERVGSSHVIAVDVVPPHDLQVELAEVQSPSGWWLLWNKLNPFARNVDLPNIVSILQRAGELSSVYGRQRLIDANIADLYLQPAVENIRIADFSKVDESAQIGYDDCKQTLGPWWTALDKTHSPR